jgi:uncharacterized protein (TIGR02452 family)
MPTFTSQIPRDDAAALGREAVSLGELASYRTSSGHRVNIKAQITFAVQETQSYPPDLSPTYSIDNRYATHIEITNETTLSAARRLLQQGLSTVALNFASATSPGENTRTPRNAYRCLMRSGSAARSVF